MACCSQDFGRTLPEELVKINVTPRAIKPVGISPVVVVDGKVATQISGRGTGILNKFVDVAKMVYSTAKPSGGTSSAGTPILTQVGNMVGNGTYEQTVAETKANGGNGFVTLIFVALIAKLLNLF
jgi:hypothetical protein